MAEENKYSLKETKEVYDFLMKAMSELSAHKADDGKIDTTEWIRTTISTAPSAIKAFMGVDRIDDELKDLNEDESKELAAMGVNLMREMLSIFMPDLGGE